MGSERFMQKELHQQTVRLLALAFTPGAADDGVSRPGVLAGEPSATEQTLCMMGLRVACREGAKSLVFPCIFTGASTNAEPRRLST